MRHASEHDGRIYASAENVVVWLGEEDADTRVALPLIAHLFDNVPSGNDLLSDGRRQTALTQNSRFTSRHSSPPLQADIGSPRLSRLLQATEM